jgi:hypothetical protein
MEIQYQLTQKDFYEALVIHRNKVSLKRWPFRIVALFFVGMLLFGSYDIVVRQGDKGLASYAPFFAFTALWVALLWWSPRWSARVQFRKQPSVQGSRSVTVDASGTHSRWDGGSADVEWKNYVRFVEGRNLFLIYTSPACFGMVPKRAFDEPGLATFRNLLQENIPTSRKPS